MTWWTWCALCLGALGCGSVRDEPADALAAGDSPPGSDAPIDTSTTDAPSLPRTAALWLAAEDSPTDGATDSAGTHATTCTSCPVLVAGRVGSAYAFTADRLTVAAATDLEPGAAFTLAMWVRVDTAPSTALGNAMIACKTFGQLDCSYALSISPGLVPQFYTSSNTNPNLDSTNSFPLGTWHHVALTWNGQLKTIFIDGASNTSAVASTISTVATGGITIGERSSTNMPLSFTGAIDELMVFERVLTAAEIGQLATP